MIRMVLREKISECDEFHGKLKIGVVPLTPYSGATFIATSLVKLLSQRVERKVTYLEVSGPKLNSARHVYDALGMDRRFAGRKFHDFYGNATSNSSFRGNLNLDEGINWILRIPPSREGISGVQKEEGEWTELSSLRLIHNASGDTIICDITINDIKRELLLEMDVLIVVIDPAPSSLLGGYDFLAHCKMLEEKGMNIIWVVNKHHDGILMKEAMNYLNIKTVHAVPEISHAEICQAEYQCMIPIASRSIRSKCLRPLEKIIECLPV